MITLIVRETNREGKRRVTLWNENKEGGENKVWNNIEEHEVLSHIGLVIAVGAYRSVRKDLKLLWGEEHGRPIFRAVMTLKRFSEISDAVRFNNLLTREERMLSDKLAAFKIRVRAEGVKIEFGFIWVILHKSPLQLHLNQLAQ